jgi:endoglucanase
MIIATAGVTIAAPGSLDRSEWRLYQERFITADGRVVDTGNGNGSHSEGQGYAMLLAVAYQDPVQFERLWRWTRTHLQIRDDRLFAWRWQPDGEVADRNSAADGDILIAWALARAAELWEKERYLAESRAIAVAVLERLTVDAAGRRVLLPGPEGFVHGKIVTINLSYWVFPAMRELALVAPSPVWEDVAASGLALLREARFGRFGLPPDWLALTRPPRPSPRFSPVFGYNALRIPLHLVGGGFGDRDLLEPFHAYAAAHAGAPPATLDLVGGATSAEAVSAGGRAVLALAAMAPDEACPPLPSLRRDMDYFASSLLLLSKLACAERSPT